MPKFIPEPKYEENWWKSHEVYNIIGFDGEFCDDQINAKPGNWVAYAVYHSEFMPPFGGYRVLFPTATDCLNWIRWMVLPEECLNGEEKKRTKVVLTGKAKEIAEIIDGATDKTPSEEILRLIRDAVIKDIGKDKDIYFIGSIEEDRENY